MKVGGGGGGQKKNSSETISTGHHSVISRLFSPLKKAAHMLCVVPGQDGTTLERI